MEVGRGERKKGGRGWKTTTRLRPHLHPHPYPHLQHLPAATYPPPAQGCVRPPDSTVAHVVDDLCKSYDSDDPYLDETVGAAFDSDSEDGLDYPSDPENIDEDAAAQVYTSYMNAALEWDNHPLDEATDWKYSIFLQHAALWSKWKRFGQKRRDVKRKFSSKGRGRGKDRVNRQKRPSRSDMGFDRTNKPIKSYRFMERPRFKFNPRTRRAFSTSKTNPLGSDGKPIECGICKSTEHLRA